MTLVERRNPHINKQETPVRQQNDSEGMKKYIEYQQQQSVAQTHELEGAEITAAKGAVNRLFRQRIWGM